MSSVAGSVRSADHGSLHSILFPSSGNFRYTQQQRGSQASENNPPSPSGETGAPVMVIWGTDVNVEACKRQFKKFIQESKFTVEEADMDEARLEWQRSDEPRPLYLTKLEEILQVPNEPFLTVNCAHLKEFNETLYRQLVDYPGEVVQIFDMAATELFSDLYADIAEPLTINVRPFNIDQTYTIRELNPSDSGKLMTISGMVTRCSSLVPEMSQAFFKCSVCTFTRTVEVTDGRVAEPHVCTNCNSKFCFTLIHNRCRYVDKQLIKLQESPDDMPAGQTPATVALVACADLVEKVNPGDRIFVTGIYRLHPVRTVARMRKLKNVFRTTIDCIHFRKVKAGRLHDESTSLRFNPDRVDAFKALAQDENIYQRLASSLCPAIFGHMDVKKGVLLQLFGGTKKTAPGSFNDPKMRHFRPDLNVLLCGDPGTSKSQILQFVYKLMPRGQYTSGRGSSAVGLTAYVTKDADTNQLVLQTGALVMCDGGICCIDEFDKMTESTRSVLHEVMEQQTLSIAKAGIVCQLNARTSVLAAANPVDSEWDTQKTVIDNVKLPDTLLSRFDLIFLLLDPNNQTYDRQLAKHLISIYHCEEESSAQDFIENDLLRDYIAFARAKIHPKLNEESKKCLIDRYLELREVSSSGVGRINVYPRNLESLIRLSEAHAKMRLSSDVNVEDVDEAVRLTREALKHAWTDPTTGKIGPVLTV